MKLLHVDSSILGAGSASRVVTREVVERWKAAVPGLQVQHLDLGDEPLPHLTGRSLAKVDEIEAARDARTLADFKAADVVVIGAPMYNFGLSTQLKAWIDRIVVAGQTFRYTAQGPEGLAGDKRVVIVASSGDVYPQNAPGEYVETYLKFVFGFIGVTDVTVVRAEGLAISPENRQKGLESAVAAAHGLRPGFKRGGSGPNNSAGAKRAA
jgi:FMN-dependent NADH-azoreductase